MFPGNQIAQSRSKAVRCYRASKEWGDAQSPAQLKVNPPLLAHKPKRLKMGERNWVRQFENGFPLDGWIQVPGVYRAQHCPDPELSSEQLLVSSKSILMARRANVTYPKEGVNGPG